MLFAWSILAEMPIFVGSSFLYIVFIFIFLPLVAQ